MNTYTMDSIMATRLATYFHLLSLSARRSKGVYIFLVFWQYKGKRSLASTLGATRSHSRRCSRRLSTALVCSRWLGSSQGPLGVFQALAALTRWLKEMLSFDCYASSNAATDVIASKVALGLRVTCFRGIGMEFSGVQDCGYLELGKASATDFHPYDQTRVLLLCWQTADSNNLSGFRAFSDFLEEGSRSNVAIYQIEGTGFKPDNNSLKRELRFSILYSDPARLSEDEDVWMEVLTLALVFNGRPGPCQIRAR